MSRTIKAMLMMVVLGGCTVQPVVRPVFLAYPESPSFLPVQSDDWQAADCKNLDALYRKVATRDIQRRQYEAELRAILDANNTAAREVK